MGIVELPVRQLGMEAAGVVTAVGVGVEGFCVGDRVVCLKKHAFATTFTTPQFCCAKIPDRLSFDEAACSKSSEAFTTRQTIIDSCPRSACSLCHRNPLPRQHRASLTRSGM